jgi:hypothetical protein
VRQRFRAGEIERGPLATSLGGREQQGGDDVARVDRLLARRAAAHQEHDRRARLAAQRGRGDLARPEHHRHAQHRGRHRAAQQRRVGAALRREAGVRALRARAEDAEAHDAPHAGALRGGGDDLAGALVGVGVARAARLLEDADEVDPGRAALRRARQRVAVAQIHHARVGALAGERVRSALAAHERARASGGGAQEAPSDAPVGAGHEDRLRIRAHRRHHITRAPVSWRA